MSSPTQRSKPNKAILDYIKATFSYDPLTGIITKDGKKIGARNGEGYINILIKAPNPIGDGSIFLLQTRGHRIGWFLEYGEWPDLDIDHIDRNTSNNQLANLRLATMAQNILNSRIKDKSKYSSQYKGVRFNKDGRKHPWEARLTIMGKSCWIGGFLTEEEAARAYDAKALEHYGEYALLNFSLGDGFNRGRT
jgi:hypothetical protein